MTSSAPPAAPPLRHGLAQQIEVLTAIEPVVAAEMGDHLARRKLWFPNDLTPADADGGEAQEQIHRDIQRNARGLPDSVRVAVALNLLTEEGLPHFHRLIAQYMGNESVWRAWNNVWTAEEDRHGCCIRDYVRDARLFNMRELEHLQYQYIAAGFDPEWHADPYRLLAYTSLQEKATQVSHANTGRMAGEHEPHLQRVLAHVAGDESRHYLFYRAAFTAILKTDPTAALQALLRVTQNFAMPGHNIDGFDALADVLQREDIFSTRQYLKIMEELWQHWDLAHLSGLNGDGAQALDKLLKLPERLARMADRMESRRDPRSYRFSFLANREFTLA